MPLRAHYEQKQGGRKVAQHGGWHRQAQLGDGDFPGHGTIAKAFGLDDATWKYEMLDRTRYQGFSGAFFTSQIMTSGQWFSVRKARYWLWPFRK